MRIGCVLAIVIGCATAATAQTLPAASGGDSRGTAGAAASALPKNLETMLASPMTLDAPNTTLAALMDSLRGITQTNIVINWNALLQAGITRETPVDLHLKEVRYEQLIRTLLEMLPAKGTRANYVVGDNTLEITTDLELGKGVVGRFSGITRQLSYAIDQPSTPESQAQNGKVIEQVMRSELIREGEPMEVKGHTLAIRDNTLVASVSQRGQEILKRMEALLNMPTRVGQPAIGTSLTPAGKKTQDALKAVFSGHTPPLTAADIAREPEKYRANLNIALLPGTKEELEKGVPEIASAINEGGVVLLGPKGVMNHRTVLAVYDLRDLIRRLNGKNPKRPATTAMDYQAAIVTLLQENIKPEGGWGGAEDLAKSPAPDSVMIPYNGLLIVFATAEMQRTIAAGLADMNR